MRGSTAAEGTKAERTVIGQKLCLVMGGPINQAIYVDHEGLRVYLCCHACVAEFESDPDK